MTYTANAFMQWLYQQDFGGENELERCAPGDFFAVRDQKRALLRQKIGIEKLESFGFSPITAAVGQPEERDGYTQQEYVLELLPQLKIPFHILRPQGAVRSGADGRPRAMLYCHGHGEGGYLDCLVERQPPAYHKNLPITLARRGYLTCLFEPVAFGELYLQGFPMGELPERVTEGCYPLQTQLLLHGLTLVGLRVYTAMKLVDFLLDTLGCGEVVSSGISGGGMLTALLSSLCDRLRANVICCYTNTFRASIMSMYHCVDNFIPGICEVGEEPYLLALAAPRPTFISAGIRDPLFPVEATRQAVEVLRRLYEKAGAPREALAVELFDGVHEISPAFIDWVDAL